MIRAMARVPAYFGPVQARAASEWSERFGPYPGLAWSTCLLVVVLAHRVRGAFAAMGVLVVVVAGLAVWVRRSAALFEPGQVTVRTLTWTKTFHAREWSLRERQGAYSIVWLGLESMDGHERVETSSLARPARIRWYPRLTVADRCVAAARRAGFTVERIPDPVRDFVEKHERPEQ